MPTLRFPGAARALIFRGITVLALLTACSAESEEETRFYSGMASTIRVAPYSATGSTALASISVDGKVKIDMAAVERCYAEQKPAPCFYYAALILAVRDGTWEPMQ